MIRNMMQFKLVSHHPGIVVSIYDKLKQDETFRFSARYQESDNLCTARRACIYHSHRVFNAISNCGILNL